MLPLSPSLQKSFFFLLISIQIMAILDHFGYSTHPMEDYDDPLWYNRDDFRPWLEHIKDSKRLIIIDDSAASPKPSKPDAINKKLQVTSEKIKAKSGREIRARSYKTEPDPMEGESSFLKKRDGRAEKRPKRGAKKTKVSHSSPRTSPAREETPRPTTGGKSPRIFSIKASKSKESSDVDTSSSESNSE